MAVVEATKCDVEVGMVRESVVAAGKVRYCHHLLPPNCCCNKQLC